MYNDSIPTPVRIYLDVTSFCPLNCIHCYADAKKEISNELTLSELKNFTQQIIELGIKNLIISGGEPLSRSDILDFLSFCYDKKIDITLLTNGVLIDSRISKALSDLSIDVRISIDGISERTHDYIRGKGNLKIVRNSLNTLKKAKVNRLSVHFTVNRININEILQLPNFLNELDIRDVVISTIKPVGRALCHPEILIEPSLVLLVKERLNTIYRNRFINFRKHEDKNWNGLSCPAANTKCGITAEGRVTPCVFLGKEYLGESIRNSPFKEIWETDNILKEIRTVKVNQQCSSCSCFDDFNGGCRARAIYYNKEVDGIDPYCCELKKLRLIEV